MSSKLANYLKKYESRDSSNDERKSTKHSRQSKSVSNLRIIDNDPDWRDLKATTDDDVHLDAQPGSFRLCVCLQSNSLSLNFLLGLVNSSPHRQRLS
jgi:hypothetical protein